MNPRHSLRHMRISQAAIAKILWHAIEAGADGQTLNAIRLYISDPTQAAPQGIDSTIYALAVAETDRAALRSSRAREAAARRRAAASHDSTSATADAVTEVQKVETTAVVPDRKSTRSLERRCKKEKRRALRARRKGTGAVMNTSSPWRQAPSGR